MYGPHSTWSSSGGFKLFDKYARNLPGVERLSIYEGGRTVHSYVDGRKIASSLKRTDDEFWQILDFTFLEGGPYRHRRMSPRRGSSRSSTRRRGSGSSTGGRRSGRPSRPTASGSG